MDNVAERPPARHAPTGDVTLPRAPFDPLPLFAAGVTFLPARAVYAPSGPGVCYVAHTDKAPVDDHDTFVAIDWRTPAGDWQRETVCCRCAAVFIAACGEESPDEAVLCWFPSEQPDAAPAPRPLGRLAALPPGMPARESAR